MIKSIEYKFISFEKIIRNRGLDALIKYIFSSIFEFFIAIGYIYKIDLDQFNHTILNNNYNFFLMEKNDIQTIYDDYPEEIDKSIYNKIITDFEKTNIDGYVVKYLGNICGFFFLKYGDSDSNLEKSYINLKKNGFLFNDYVFLNYRGNNIQEFSISKRLQILKNKNFDTATCIVKYNNYASMVSYERNGFKKFLIKYFFRFNNLIRSSEHIKGFKNK